MLELLTALSFIGYLIYLRYYADQRTDAQKEVDRLREGIAFYDQGQLSKAEDYFDNELAVHPKSSVIYLYRARIKRARGDLARARADVEQGKSYDASLADLHLESGQIYYEQGDYPAAFRDFDKAVFTSFGQETEPYRWRGFARQQLHEDELG